jgi:hypothetical protein
MTVLVARFKQSPSEVRRYVLDYTLQMSPGETISTITPTISSPTGGNLNLVVSNIAIASSGLQAQFFVSGGQVNQSYEIDFVTTTSIAQTFEDVVQIDIASKV